MSKLDFFTVFIVSVCLAALGYLVYKTIKLRELKNASTTTQIASEQTSENLPADTIAFDDEGSIVDSKSAADADLDDEQLSVDDGTLVEEEEAVATATDDASSAQETATREEEPEVPKSFNQPSATSSGNFMVLAGSFKQKSNAEAQVRRLKGMGFDQAEVASFNGGVLAVALVDRFDSYDDASRLVNTLKSKGVDAFVKRKK